ncbi:fibrinogen-like protein 1-like protein isoform X2 [Chrysemys picta bellii]|uniref:fibrinogen-like protein 1-like protein isoform X2 n=1 Tax=Chrysemys picta bellii TaxID=8478 RepID=UPI0032B17B10
MPGVGHTAALCPGPLSPGTHLRGAEPCRRLPSCCLCVGFQSSSLLLLSALSMMVLLCVAPVQGNGTLAHKKVERGFPKDCSNIPRDSPSGVQVIQPAGSPPRVVWCDMDTEGKGWTVVQRNSYNTEITWKESWSTYKYGFGNVQQDYWLGNEYLSLLTRQNIYKVRFVVEDKSNNTRYAEYDIFSVEVEPSGYPLRLGRYSGDGEDYLTTYHSGLGGIHDNMKFSTSDKDQDQTSGNCASSYGGWWYDKCQNVLLNRKGYIYWAGFCKSGECKSSLILVKPTDVCWVRQEEPILLGSSAAEKGRQY